MDEGDNVTPIDVLVILNHMYDNGGADPSYSQTETPGRFLDVNFDGKVTPVDSNIVIEYLETNGPGPFVLECPDEEVGTLTVVQKSLATTDVVVANENNVVLLAFEASADDIGDIFVTSARFTASVGDTVNAEGLDLWADTDNNGTGDTIVAEAPDGNFDNIFGGGYVIPAGETVRFEVHGDMASSFSGNQFQLAFADNPITAEALDDGSELEGINVITTDSTLFTLQSSGTLTVTEDSTPVRSHQLLGGTLSEAVLRLSLSADAEDVDVTYIGVDILGPDRSIDRLEAFLPGATTPFAVGTKAGAITGDNYGFRMPNRELVVGKGSNQDVIIKVRVNADTNGGVRGDTFAADVDAVFAQGGISSNDIAADIAADIVGPYHTVVMSKISSIVNVNPDANGTAVPTGPSNVGQFKFAAAANTNTQNGLNKVVVDQLTFTVNAVNVAMDAGAFRFINKADATVSSSTYRLERLDGTATAASGTITGSFRVIFTGLDASLVDTEISQGEDKTFVLQVNVTNPNTSTQVSSLQVSLQLDDPGFIRWLDRDNGGSTQFSWIEYPDTTVKSTSYQS
ncbi:hypothetical protein A3F36_00280 [Candidatus Peribacteria bacterium RIFCSPHIGHO2_12_FULL_55_11]|nr:MAG: hypothetical protein A3F36_00280 [Candidatus Peribacteria bacterium RIFCSPHIGHO2_12_FULL_55_11]